MTATISGRELSRWRERALAALVGTDLSPVELDRFLRGVSDLDTLSLRLGSFRDREAIPLRFPLPEIERRWRRRVESRCPLQYLLESVTWRDLTLKVSPAVLIPRPETEALVDLVRARSARRETGDWVDLGTGSGAIAIALAKVLTEARVHAVDLSEAALAIARENVSTAGLDGRISLYAGSWWTPLAFLRGKVSAMVSNPPYIPTAELAGLQPEVGAHEPRLALDGGEDGLNAIRYLIDTAPDYLRPGGIWGCEMMAGQGETVARLLRERGEYDRIEIVADLAGLDRHALAYRV